MFLVILLALPPAPATAESAIASLDEARALHREGRLDAALAAYRSLRIDPGTSPADRGTAANNACVILLDAGRFGAAQEACREARAIREDLDDPQRLARTLNNFAAALEGAGEYREAQGVYEQAMVINRAGENWESLTINLANLGVLATRMGRFGPALEFYRRAEDLARRFGDSPWAAEQVRLAALNRGVVLEKVGAFRAALDTFRKIDPAALGADRRAALLINYGVIYRNLGDPLQALREFDRAGELIADDDFSAQANLWLDRALVYHLNLEDYPAALAAYDKALRLAERSGRVERLATLVYLARLQLDRGEIVEARRLYGETLALAADLGSNEAQWSALEGLARVQLVENRPAAAMETLQRAMSLIEATRAGFDPGRLRMEFFGSQRSAYRLAVETAWRLHAGNPDAMALLAFRIAQRAKARELLASLPATRGIGGDTYEPADGELVLEYFFGESHLYAWLQWPSGLTFHRLGRASPLRAAAAALRTRLAAPADSAAGDDLAATLLAPLSGRPDGSKRLLIAPDDLLFHLPFELLPLDDEPLLDTHVVLYMPSSAVAARSARDRETDPALQFAGFGAPEPEVLKRYALEPLPMAAAELAQLDRSLPGSHRVAIGQAATETSFLETLERGVEIVHVATHTVFDDRLGSAIVFTPDQASDGLLYPAEIAGSAFDVGLTILAACRTAGSGIEDGHAISTLGGALLAAGSSAVLATLWDIDDRYTAYFMQEFYRHLAGSRNAATALRRTKMAVRARAAPGDAAWAAFVLMGDADTGVRRGPAVPLLIAGLALLVLLAVLRRRLRG